jgi:hypothetical protein
MKKLFLGLIFSLISTVAFSAQTLTIDPDALIWRTPDVLRSSAFLNPTNQSSLDAYLSITPNHHVSRIMVWEWALSNSTSVTSFANNLELFRGQMVQMAARHDKLIVYIAKMPRWLSQSNDTSDAGSGWQVFNTYPPNDWQTWADIVTAGTAFFESFDVEIYYEVWNEPDGASFWSLGISEYLELYEQTVQGIRSTSPTAKVGGSASNRWDSGFNHKLIEYVGQNNLSLDFLSWHLFASNAVPYVFAAQSYNEAIEAVGIERPEFVISEWNNSGLFREAPEAAAYFSGHFVWQLVANIDMQTVAAWQDFHPDDNHGLIGWDGAARSVLFAHLLFDDLARSSHEVAVFNFDNVYGVQRG